MLAWLLNFIITPIFSKMKDEQLNEQLNYYFNLFLKIMLLFYIPFVLGSILFAREILEILFNYNIAFYATPVLRILSIASAFYGLTVLFSQLFLLNKQTNLLMLGWIMALIVNLTINLLLLPRYGIIIAALAQIFSYATLLLFGITYGAKQAYLSVDFRYLPKISVYSLGLLLPFYFLKIPLLVAIPILIFLYIIGIIKFNLIHVDELKVISSI